MDSRLRYSGILLFCVIVWALSFPVIKFLLLYLNPIPLSFIRFSLASLALLPIFMIYREGLVEEFRKRPLLYLAFSALVVPIPDLSQNFGMRMMDPETAASVASILQPMSPIFVLILATLILKERFTVNKGIGISLGFAGAVLLATDGFSNIRSGNLLGEGLILLSGFSYALSGIIGKRILTEVEDRLMGPLSAIVWSYFLGSIMLFPAYLCEAQMPPIDAQFMVALLFLSLFTLIPYFLWYVVLREHEVSRQSAYVFLIPLFGVLFSALLMGESLRVSMILYGALIMLGVYVAQMKK